LTNCAPLPRVRPVLVSTRVMPSKAKGVIRVLSKAVTAVFPKVTLWKLSNICRA
jgi:hypothetical protein